MPLDGKTTSGAKRHRYGALLLAVAVGIALCALWLTGFSPARWWANRITEQQASAAKRTPAPPSHGYIGVVKAEPVGTDSSVSKVPLPLILTATRLGRNSREGYADIGVNAHWPQTYRAGAILANGARLEEIYSDHVILAHEALRTSLYILGHTPPAGAHALVASLITVGGTTPAPAAVADSRDALTEVVRIAPLFEGDHVRALELYPSAHSSLFERLGLEPGDRVIAIDGEALTDSKQAIEELRRLTAGASVNVTIERGGRHQTLSLDGSLLISGTRS
jgi:general secretion pathway protein C